MPDPIRLAAVVLALPVMAAIGQTAPAPAAVPPGSVFEAYRPFTDEPVISWKEANDQVGRIGGWRAYAREAQGEEAAPAPRPAASAPAPRAPAGGAPKAGPHAGHH